MEMPGGWDKAIPLLDRSMRISEENGYTDQLIDALEIMVPLLEQRGDVREALRRYEQMVGLKDSLYVLETGEGLERYAGEVRDRTNRERTAGNPCSVRAPARTVGPPAPAYRPVDRWYRLDPACSGPHRYPTNVRATAATSAHRSSQNANVD
jgi:hypothetical protein